jgi:branched-chain amino acid transport system ATP-binding protein
MSPSKPQEPEEVDADAVEWHVDEDGAEYFVEDGVKYVLADDGYAYPVEAGDQLPADVEAVEKAASDDVATALESEPVADSDDHAELADTTIMDAVRVEDVPREDDSAPQDEAFRPGYVRTPSQDSDDESTHYAPLLSLSAVKSGYGRLPVLHGVDFEIAAGQTAVVLGLNGAGKTTTAMNICGALGTWDGVISFDGQDITRWGTRQCVANGIVMVPEGRRVFPDLSVARNLEVGAWSQRRDHDWLKTQQERVFEYFPRLRERAAQLAGTLSGGEQQMLAIGRGLMANPRLLIIDEASMGLAPVIVKDVFEIVSHINEDGVTVMMIEQNVGALDVADVGIVMEQGRVIRELRGSELSDRSLVSEVLMG